MFKFKLRFQIVRILNIYRVVIVLKFLNPPGLWLAYFSKGLYQDSQMKYIISLKITFWVRALGAFNRNTCQNGPCPAIIMLTTFVSEATENLLTWFRIFISWLFCNHEEIDCGGKGYCYDTQFWVCTTMTSYTKRCTSTRRVCWCKFGRNPLKSFWVICILMCLSLVPRQILLVFPYPFLTRALIFLFVSP